MWSSACRPATGAARSWGGKGEREAEWPRCPDGLARAAFTSECRTATRGTCFPFRFQNEEIERRETACLSSWAFSSSLCDIIN